MHQEQIMDDDLRARIQRLEDRQDIHDCLIRYSRGVDRLDRAMLLSAYHPDAIDDHGMFVGPPDEFADWVFALHSRINARTQHYIINHYCELDGDVAHTETYYLTGFTDPEDRPLHNSGGRYVDRFERRNGRWAIAARKCLSEWRGAPGSKTLWCDGDPRYAVHQSARDPSDASYERPLTIDPGRIGQAWPPYEFREK